MTYNPDKPDEGPSPNDDASIIKDNFAQYKTVFGNNHKAINTKNQGDHQGVVFTLQTSDPSVTEDLTVLYSKNAPSPAGTEPQLFVRIPDFLPTQFDSTTASNTPMQLTYNEVNTAGPVYQSFLPGGYIMYMGTTSDITVINTVTPAPTSLLVAIAMPNAIPGSGTPRAYKVATNIVSASTFWIYSNAPALTTFTWMAIGSA